MNNHLTMTSTKRTKKGYDSLQHHTFCLNQLLNSLMAPRIPNLIQWDFIGRHLGIRLGRVGVPSSLYPTIPPRIVDFSIYRVFDESTINRANLGLESNTTPCSFAKAMKQSCTACSSIMENGRYCFTTI
jgi:hypothetical protein